MKKLLTILTLMLPSLAFGQWRVGVNGGADYNHFIIDKHYQTDYVFEDRWGLTLGVMGQYDINSWLGIRAELDWTQKNYRHTREVKQSMCYDYTNNYLQLPVMATFSFGGQKLRGFCNAGCYLGHWLNSGRKGFDTSSFDRRVYDISEDIELNSTRDQRFDFGFLGGLGLEYRFHRHWAAQVEMRYYYSCVSTQKDYQLMSDPRYNSTLALQAGVWYCF